MATANEQLFDASVRHQIYLQRYSGTVVNKFIALLNRSDRDLVESITRRLASIEGKGFDGGPQVTKRLQALLVEIRDLNTAAYSVAGKGLLDELRTFAEYETEWQASTLDKALPEGVSVTAPSARTVAAAATARPFQGRLLKEWLDGLEGAKAARVRDAIRLGMVEGETIDQMVKRIRGSRALGYADGLMEIDRRGAAALVRTAVNHVGSVARDAVAADNSDILKGERWTATLDGRTSAVCRGRDGTVYPVGKGPKPPAHIGCRSLRVAILSDEFADLDITGQRASMNGPVRGEETYQTWLKKQPASFQDDVLGKAKAQLFRKGGLGLDRFVNRAGDELSLDQLRAKEPAAFKKAFGIKKPEAEKKPKAAAPKPAVVAPKFAYQDFKPLQSIPEAADWLRANVADTVTLTKGTTLDGLNLLAQAIQETNERFALPKFRYLGDPTKDVFNYRSTKNVIAAYAPRTDAMIFGNSASDNAGLLKKAADNSSYIASKYRNDSIVQTIRDIHKNPDLADLAATIGDRVWQIVPGSRGVAFHEMGHRIEAMIGPELTKLAGEGFNKGWRYTVSVYGATNSQELIAESFSLYMAGPEAQHYRIYPPLLDLFKKRDRLRK